MTVRVLHVNDVAAVGSTLVRALRQLGHDAQLRRLRILAGGAPTAVKLAALPLRVAELLDVERQIRLGGFDLVHFHYAYVGILGALGRHRYVLHAHGTDVRDALHDPIRAPFARAALTHARAVLVATPDLLAIARRIRPDARFLPNPIDVERFRPAPRATDGRIRVLLISDAHPLKGVDVAARACDTLRTMANVEVHAIARSGRDERHYRSLGIDRSVPAVPHEAMPDLINAFDIVVGRLGLGSLGLNELESMSCGRPVICEFRYPEAYASPPPVTNVAGEGALREALLRLVASATERRELGERARAWIEREHEQLHVARELLSIYERLPP